MVREMKRVPCVMFVAECSHCKEQIRIVFDRKAIDGYSQALDEAEKQQKKQEEKKVEQERDCGLPL